MKARSGELLFRLAGLAAIAILVNASPAYGDDPDCTTVDGCTACIVENEPNCVFVFGSGCDTEPFIHCFPE